jgi:hypothetical protein
LPGRGWEDAKGQQWQRSASSKCIFSFLVHRPLVEPAPSPLARSVPAIKKQLLAAFGGNSYVSLMTDTSTQERARGIGAKAMARSCVDVSVIKLT